MSAGRDADLDAWLSRSAAAAQSVLDEYAWGEELTIPWFVRKDEIAWRVMVRGCYWVPDLTRMRHD